MAGGKGGKGGAGFVGAGGLGLVVTGNADKRGLGSAVCGSAEASAGRCVSDVYPTSVSATSPSCKLSIICFLRFAGIAFIIGVFDLGGT